MLAPLDIFLSLMAPLAFLFVAVTTAVAAPPPPSVWSSIGRAPWPLLLVAATTAVARTEVPVVTDPAAVDAAVERARTCGWRDVPAAERAATLANAIE